MARKPGFKRRRKLWRKLLELQRKQETRHKFRHRLKERFIAR
jgi:hypothetical protein